MRNPGEPYPRMVRGSILISMGRFEEGIKSYDASIARDDCYTPGYLVKANALGGAGRYDEAVACCDAVLERCPAGRGRDADRAQAITTKSMWEDLRSIGWRSRAGGSRGGRQPGKRRRDPARN